MSANKLLIKFAKPYPLWIVASIILGFSGALFNGVSTTLIVPVLLNLLGQSIDLKGAPPIIQVFINPFDAIPQEYRLLIMAIAIVMVIILKNAAGYLGSLVSSSLTRRLTSDMRVSGLRMLLEVDLTYYYQAKVGDLVNSLGGEIGRAATAINTVIKMVITSITILVFVGILLAISWQLTLATTLLLFLVALINQYSINRSKHFGKMVSDMSRSYSIRILETMNGIRLVKSTGNEEKEYQRIYELIQKRELADFQCQVNSAAIAPVSEVTGILALILIVIFARTFFKSEVASFSTVLLTYLLVLFRLLPFISQLNGTRSAYANSAPSVEIVYNFLRRDNKPFMPKGNLPYQPIQKGIRFSDVSFAYPSKAELVLKNINLYLPRGTTLALVGASGAGKSTIADLLPRFYDPTSGSITIDDTDIREFEIKSFRSAMGIVSQDTFLFNDTIRNNIAYGRPEATEEEIFAAAKRANAYEFIERMPQKFDTLIGDRGVLLSGGQRQRLAIARALLQDPDILILDEATSALDTVSERLVQAAIEDLSRDRTTLVIAHRLSTVQKANQIVVLDQGKVVEIGTHDELLNKGGYYSRLYTMQFAKQPGSNSLQNKVLLKAAYEIRNRISYEVRTRLNAMIGVLRLMADGMVENPIEQQELLEESYTSALNLLNTLERIENLDKARIK